MQLAEISEGPFHLCIRNGAILLCLKYAGSLYLLGAISVQWWKSRGVAESWKSVYCIEKKIMYFFLEWATVCTTHAISADLQLRYISKCHWAWGVRFSSPHQSLGTNGNTARKHVGDLSPSPTRWPPRLTDVQLIENFAHAEQINALHWIPAVFSGELTHTYSYQYSDRWMCKNVHNGWEWQP